uniref:Uncharacterized protein n=1 Tax=Aegilops tauschii subsp. strangulata TaxID=200361 RepID=A0A453JSW7_AEGTS
MKLTSCRKIRTGTVVYSLYILLATNVNAIATFTLKLHLFSCNRISGNAHLSTILLYAKHQLMYVHT